MQYPSFSDIRTKVERELDLEAEEFIQPLEFQSYVNDAIDEAEAEIHKLGLDDMYFLSKANIALTTGEDEYALPSNIYANKIVRLVYANGSTIYTIFRLRGHMRFEQIEQINQYGTATDFYRFMVTNDSTTAGPRLVIFPAAKETSTTNVKIWYIRNANRMTADTDLCDIPEIGLQFLYAVS